MISIIIPTHNRPDYLARSLNSAIESLKSQGEIIVIDDGSVPPVSISVPNKSKVKLLRNEKALGASIARNQGVKAASENLILFLDDDDILENDYVNRILEIRTKHKTAIFGFSNYFIIGNNKNINGKVRKNGHSSGREKLRSRLSGLGMGFWIDRNLFQAIGGLDASLLIDEDTDLCVRLAAKGVQPWRETVPGVSIERGSAFRLTNSSSDKTAALSYFRTMEKNIGSFSQWSEARYFLCNRALKKCIKAGLPKLANVCISHGGNCLFKFALRTVYLVYMYRNR